jgi:hypothetical protein
LRDASPSEDMNFSVGRDKCGIFRLCPHRLIRIE